MPVRQHMYSKPVVWGQRLRCSQRDRTLPNTLTGDIIQCPVNTRHRNCQLFLEHGLAGYSVFARVLMFSEGLTRDQVEAAIDRFEELGEVPGFGDAREYWVRSTRKRGGAPYPSKPVVALALTGSRQSGGPKNLDQIRNRLSGGWSNKNDAASLLHNAGFIIVREDGRPVKVPDERFLAKGAERIRHCALNYYIAPERERGQQLPASRVYTYRPHKDGYTPKKQSIIELYAVTIAAQGPQTAAQLYRAALAVGWERPKTGGQPSQGWHNRTVKYLEKRGNLVVMPANERGQRSVSIRAGTLHDEMGLYREWPNVCQVLAGKKFQEMARVRPPSREGPVASTTTIFKYKLEPHVPEPGPTTSPSTNLILYGPPGTGKTYSTAYEAVRICLGDEEADRLNVDRKQLMKAYQELVKQDRIEFVTFHQSFSYEDFVEGLRPTTENSAPDEETGEVSSSGGFSLKTHAGVFKRISERARLDTGVESGEERLDRTRPIFKVALGRRGQDEHQVQFGLDEGLIHLGWGGDIDWADERFDDFNEICGEWRRRRDPDATGHDSNIVQTFSLRAYMQLDDYVVLSDGRDRIRAFGRVTGDYYYDAEAEFHPHRRKVEWLWQDTGGAERSTFYPNFFRRHSVYQLKSEIIDWDALENLVLDTDVSELAAGAREFVLIIDEINRANISKVFGELITLLESDKRLGARNELRVRLPYSGTRFGVPSNLHVIGTMNTADRSIALLDTALRRRFTFRELMPDPSVLSEDVEGIDLRMLLAVLNERIEYLFDREHQIGHAYFIECETQADVESAMRDNVIPLLAEYFYDDWTKVAAVLEGQPTETGRSFDGCFLVGTRLVPQGLEGDSKAESKLRWTVKEEFDFSKFKRS